MSDEGWSGYGKIVDQFKLKMPFRVPPPRGQLRQRGLWVWAGLWQIVDARQALEPRQDLKIDLGAAKLAAPSDKNLP